MKILIADDDAICRLVLQLTIEKFGHQCLVAEDGLHAWRLLQNTADVDVIVSDWMMPTIDGLELCRRVRQKACSHYIYFIFLTALTDKERLLKGMQTGADYCLSKPLDSEQLKVCLDVASQVNS
ncbi:MAG: response regulator [Pseudomonadota bacterium]|nr:response regulator [Pseudomonadota bacterium]